jgi:hypothetical protein
MPFQVSPGVNVSEIDLTTIVPAVSSTEGALAGVFRWGPIDQRVLVDNETVLASRFGKPSNLNAETWFTGASFLGYGNRLFVSRAANTTGSSPSATVTVTANNKEVILSSGNTANLAAGMSVISSSGEVAIGAVIGSIINSTAFELTTNTSAIASGSDTLQFVTNTVFTAIVNTASVADLSAQIVKNETDFETKSFNDTDVKFVARFPGELGNSLKVSVCGNASGFQSTLNLSSNAATISVATNANTGTLTIVGTAQFTNATFNANTGANGTTEFITTTAPHGFSNGDEVVYVVASGNTALTGLTNGNTYYIVASNTTSFQLENTIGGGALDITASSTSETGHTISRTDATAGQNANTRLNALANLINITDKLEIGNTSLGIQYMTITALSNAVTNATHSVVTINFEDQFKLSQNYSANNTLTRYWEYFDVVDTSVGLSEYQINFGNNAVNSDEMHVIVVDEDGKHTGVPGTILETYRAVSRSTDAKTVDGAANYYRTVINDASQYIYAVNDLSGASSNTAENLTSSTLDVASYSFGLGKDGQDEANIPLGVITTAYDMFKSAEDVDISLVLTGKSNNFQLGNYLIDNISEARRDCVVFVSPQKGNVVNNIGNEAESIVSFRNSLRSTSYGVLDSGYKYMYDRYNDVYRWIPLNGDVAGLCARSDNTNDPWWSPAGFNRGQIKNLVKLAFNPRKAERDTLYKAGINPVVTFPGQGTVLFGDKTLLAKPSAFDRINVRRLFIVLEKAISTASKFTLFEFNDDFTRAQFRNLVTPYLRDVQGRRGITDFQVVCDASNNTAEIVDRNEFVGDIYIKPARSINFIQLNFVAVRTGVSFSEVVGRF